MKWIFENIKELSTLLIVLLFSAMCIMLFVVDVPKDNESVVLILLGALSSTIGAIFGYWYGSSEKDKKEAVTGEIPE